MQNTQIEIIAKSEFQKTKIICKLPKPKFSNQSWNTIHQQFVQYGRNAKEWLRKCALLLPQIERQQIWRKKRFNSIYEYAAKLAGMSRNQVNDALWILKKIEDKPALIKVAEEKGLNAVRPILTLVTQENANFLADKSRNTSHHALRAYVKGIKQGLLIPSEIGETNRLEFRDVTETQSANLRLPPQIAITLQLDPEIADQLQKIKGQSDWNQTIGELLKLRQEKFEEEKPKTVEAKNSNGNRTPRQIPAAIKHYVIAKTNGTCAFPRCTRPYKILHHADRFAMFHVHDPNHIFPLCEAHERLAHLGLIENENKAPQYWKIRIQPNYNDPKYEIDRVVEKYRHCKSPQN